MANGAVAGQRHVLPVLIAPPDELRHVFVDVLGDEGGQWQRPVVDGGPVLDLEDGVRGGRQGADDACVARTEGCPLNELDVPAAPPALAFAPGQVLVGAGPTAALLAVAVGANTRGLVAVSSRRKRLPVLVVLSLFFN